VSKIKLIRHGQFVREVISNGQNVQNAYPAVCPTRNKMTARTAVCKLLNNVKIKRRITELLRKGRKRTQVTLERLINDADDVQRNAIAPKSYAAAIAAA
jgi:hypothetical protein